MSNLNNANDIPLLQVIGSLECQDSMARKLLFRFPQKGLAYIKIGTEIIVHEKQVAIFCRDGKFLDILPAGKHILSIDNIPLLNALLTLDNEIPFQVAVYFISIREFSLPWGTPQPILAGNSLSNMTLLQGFGVLSFFISSPREFAECFGGVAIYSLAEMKHSFLSRILNMLTKTIGDLSNKDGMSALEILSRIKYIENRVNIKIRKDVKELGVTFKGFQISSLKPVQNAKDELLQSIKFDGAIDTQENPISKFGRVIIEEGEIFMGDKYITGQAGSVGPQSHANDMTFNQISSQAGENLDWEKLSSEIMTLRNALRERSSNLEHDIVVGEIASAEVAIKKKETTALIKHLSNAGKWAFDVATEIGATLAAEIIKKSMGL